MTTKFLLPTLIFGMLAGMSIPTNAETVKVMDDASTEAPLALAQTAGTERRQERRDTTELPSGEWGHRCGKAPLQTERTTAVVYRSAPTAAGAWACAAGNRSPAAVCREAGRENGARRPPAIVCILTRRIQ